MSAMLTRVLRVKMDRDAYLSLCYQPLNIIYKAYFVSSIQNLRYTHFKDRLNLLLALPLFQLFLVPSFDLSVCIVSY